MRALDTSSSFLGRLCETIHKVGFGTRQPSGSQGLMQIELVPVLLFVVCSTALGLGLLAVARAIGPHRDTPVKTMPYESGMDPTHDTRRRFDVRFHLVAIAFLMFDVELLFLYPWAVASRNAEGIDAAVSAGLVANRGLVFAEAMIFIALLALGYVYAWRKGVFQWR